MIRLLKTLMVISVVSTILLSCEKDFRCVMNSDDDGVTDVQKWSSPLKFNSEDDLILAIESNIGHIQTKSSNDGFVSYYETVMQEDGYEDRPNAIFSDAFGSVLNQDGEVIFGNTLIKVGKTAVFYGPVSETFQIRQLAELETPMTGLFEREQYPSQFEDVLAYLFTEDKRIYMCDTFGLYGNDYIDNSPEGSVSTKAEAINWSQQGKKEGPEMDREYVWPRGGDQKNKFSSNSKVANDTKIYKQTFGSYKEAGVKTKTMKKHGAFWKKFSADVTSAVTNVMICEGGLAAATKAPLGWLDINKTKYKGRSFMIATKVVKSYGDINAGGKATEAECNAALKWAKDQGASVSTVEGVRYVIKDDPKNCVVHLRDIIVHKKDSKNTLIFNLKTEQNDFDTDKGIFNKLDIIKSSYRVDIMFLYGYSKYNGEIKGSILRCGRYGVPNVKKIN